MRDVELVINEQRGGDEIDDDGGRHGAITQADAGKAFCAAVIFGERLQRHAPPKISVELKVPFLPTGVGGITPAFFLKQGEDLA